MQIGIRRRFIVLLRKLCTILYTFLYLNNKANKSYLKDILLFASLRVVQHVMKAKDAFFFAKKHDFCSQEAHLAR